MNVAIANLNRRKLGLPLSTVVTTAIHAVTQHGASFYVSSHLLLAWISPRL
jgi:hypothetical protein